ncbi:NAD-dependent succinate-semialdehyde dehydrogenase [Microbacterium sp. No. 7]|uniref:NAD-dependent succinate-semialdehyde dehydrogenase n=1 Tax=Microbacterium sp. No. 7 TaxID=1714373 RepID=UPI0006D2998B|nr:NAD-dependent succinate-semialdehyde dehydrogenase [Microbacterium sp. No. 7]ALJ21982.1 succinate-semialdehyde dehydrogenase [Microbacterium sp. No. 7]
MNEATTLIDGEWTALPGRREVTAPATGRVIGTVCWGDAGHARAAADAAQRAFAAWSARSGRERADILLRAAALILERQQELARLLAEEAGKRLPEALGEISFSAEYIRWFAEEARRPEGFVHAQEDPARRHLSTRSAAGVVVSLSSWNFPCSLQARKLAPALAAGCTVVIRVSERAPLAVTEMIRAFTDAGMPPGVIGLVHGPSREITGELLAHPAVRVVTFTGSTPVGSAIMRQAADRIVRPLLELGGDAPFLVFEDADLDRAVDAALLAKTRNTGQSCVAANRFLVHESVHDEFVARLAARLDALTLGDGLAEPTPDLGPMIDQGSVDAVRALADDAIARGAREATTPRDVPEGGTFLRPMLFTDVDDDARLANEEVFGPVAGVFRFRTEDEAIARANRTEMGLAAYVFSSDAARCWRVADRLAAGIVGVNDPVPSVAFAPMGGAKQSGLGREGAAIGLEEFTETKYVAWRL